WNDVDNNQAFDPAIDTLRDSTVTDLTGSYNFSVTVAFNQTLPLIVREVPYSDFTAVQKTTFLATAPAQVNPNVGFSQTFPASIIYSRTITFSSTNESGLDFGNAQPASISG